MKRLRTLLGIGLGLAVVAGAGWYITQNKSPAPARQGGRGAGVATPVGTATAAKGEIPIVIKALGTVTPLATVTIKTQITGQLVQVEFTEGQAVKQGDLLAVVDPRPYEVALQNAQGTLAKDEALLKNAQIDLQRYATLVKQESIHTVQHVRCQIALHSQGDSPGDGLRAQTELRGCRCRVGRIPDAGFYRAAFGVRNVNNLKSDACQRGRSECEGQAQSEMQQSHESSFVTSDFIYFAEFPAARVLSSTGERIREPANARPS